ncbi:hypothetical protein [Nocardioides stalactiti]|uniref:hypothetical protein n=1 Tax=Nocardioides stalactiti TaxID=2755356 RepID=UPI0015FF47FC|nr:hypothetical protein [Nocardioides stalactiti]
MSSISGARRAAVAGLVALAAVTIGGPAEAGKISSTKNWTGHGDAYTSLYADVQRDCGWVSCTSWVTSVRHYSRDWGTTYTTIVGRHKWGGISLSSATAGYKTGSVSLDSNSSNCVIKVGELRDENATFEGGGRVCSAKSNFVVYHDESSTQGSHRQGSVVEQWTVRAS